MKLFALRRVYALAMIAEGFVRFFGFHPRWALAVARVMAKVRGRELLAQATNDYQVFGEEAPK